MDLGNMRKLGVQRLVATCLNDACRHQGLIDVSKYPDNVEVPEHLGTVIAANEKEAIKAAIAIYAIEPARRNRITVTKVSDKDNDEG